MDRWLIPVGGTPLAEQMLAAYKNAMIDKAALAEAVLGQGTQVYGLAANALTSGIVSGAAFAVQIGRGFIFSYQETDPNAYGVLGTDTATSILKTGINLGTTNVGLANSAPATSGYSVNYLISAGFQEQDTNATNIPFYNASNPSSPTIESLNATRQQSVIFSVTAGAPATTGSQTTPAAPSGYVALWVVTVHNGDAAVVSGQVAASPAAPTFLTLPQLAPNAYILTGASTITAAQLNSLIEMIGSSGYTTTIPSSVGIAGQWLRYWNNTAATQTLSSPAGEFVGPGGSGGVTLSLAPGATDIITSDGVNWLANSVISEFPSSVGTNGYQKFPSGMIMQWGKATVPAGTSASTSVAVIFPVAFQSACYAFTATPQNKATSSGSNDYPVLASTAAPTTTGTTVTADNYTGAAINAVTFSYIAIGF